MRIKKENKFDVGSPKRIEFFSIDSINGLSSFLKAAKLGFMQTNRGEYAFRELIEKYKKRITDEIELRKDKRDFSTSHYLEEMLLPVFKEAYNDINQAILYKYESIKLFNNLFGVDDTFKAFIINWLVGFIKNPGLRFEFNAMIDAYRQKYAIKEGMPDELSILKNQNIFIELLIGAITEAKKSNDDLFTVLGSVQGDADFLELHRILAPAFNKYGNKHYDDLKNRQAWNKNKKAHEEMNHIINEAQKIRKRDSDEWDYTENADRRDSAEAGDEEKLELD